MAIDSASRDGVRDRRKVDLAVQSSPKEALKIARGIRHPWYRCQSLAMVAEFWGRNDQKFEVLREAFAAAKELDEINRVVTVSAWPLKVMVPWASHQARSVVEELVDRARGEAHSLRRADALFAVLSAVRSNSTLIELVMPDLIRALLEGRGWRIDRLTRMTIELIGSLAPAVVAQLVAHHGAGRKKNQLILSLNSVGPN